MWHSLKENRKTSVYLIHLFFFFLFFSIPAVNHFYLRLPALDFGIANQAMYSFARTPRSLYNWQPWTKAQADRWH
jgi:hypothetical protein